MARSPSRRSTPLSTANHSATTTTRSQPWTGPRLANAHGAISAIRSTYRKVARPNAATCRRRYRRRMKTNSDSDGRRRPPTSGESERSRRPRQTATDDGSDSDCRRQVARIGCGRFGRGERRRQRQRRPVKFGPDCTPAPCSHAHYDWLFKQIGRAHV